MIKYIYNKKKGLSLIKVKHMKYTQTLKKGTSCCFGGQLTAENLPLYKNANIDCVEISYPNVEALCASEALMNGLFKEYGIELWSIHLPFSRKLDISVVDDDARRFIIDTNIALIKKAAEIGVKVAVLHPSSEPITDEDRPERLRRSKEAIIEINKVCKAVGMKLAVENLPRTCLCNRYTEMIELLKDTGAGIVFDANHSLVDDNVEFLRALADSNIEIVSLHLSDYDGIDERHRLPGEGINDWKSLLSILEDVNYSGPLMYEVPLKPKSCEVPYSYDDLKENQRKLAAGEI